MMTATGPYMITDKLKKGYHMLPVQLPLAKVE